METLVLFITLRLPFFFSEGKCSRQTFGTLSQLKQGKRHNRKRGRKEKTPLLSIMARSTSSRLFSWIPYRVFLREVRKQTGRNAANVVPNIPSTSVIPPSRVIQEMVRDLQESFPANYS